MKRICLLLMLLYGMTVALSPAAQKTPPAPSPQAKCPVCGMFVAKYPDWTGTIVYRDGATLYFDGAKDLFTYYLNPVKYDPARKRADIAGIHVKDYYSLAAVDGRQAFYVIGSDVFGPMGKELVPFSQKADADAFLLDHRGKRVLSFGEITPQVLKSLQ